MGVFAYAWLSRCGYAYICLSLWVHARACVYICEPAILPSLCLAVTDYLTLILSSDDAYLCMSQGDADAEDMRLRMVSMTWSKENPDSC